jgi:hypothetical protein
VISLPSFSISSCSSSASARTTGFGASDGEKRSGSGNELVQNAPERLNDVRVQAVLWGAELGA